MKSLLKVSFLALSLSLVSCAMVKDSLPKAKQIAADKITSAIVEKGQCSNVSAVKSDVEDFLRIEKVDTVVDALQPDQQVQGFAVGAVVSPICQAAVKAVVPYLMDKATPAKWDCTVTDLKSKAIELASAACSKIE